MAQLKDRVKEERDRQGLTQQQLADKLGVSRNAVTNWESGHRQPELSHLEEMGRIFDRSVSYLLGDTDDPHGPPTFHETPSFHGEEIVVLFRGKPAKLPEHYLQLIKEKLQKDADDRQGTGSDA